MPITREEFNKWRPMYTRDGAYSRILDLLSRNPDKAYTIKELSIYIGYEDKDRIYKTKDKKGKIVSKKQCLGYSTIMQAMRKLKKLGYAEYKSPYLINK